MVASSIVLFSASGWFVVQVPPSGQPSHRCAGFSWGWPAFLLAENVSFWGEMCKILSVPILLTLQASEKKQMLHFTPQKHMRTFRLVRPSTFLPKKGNVEIQVGQRYYQRYYLIDSDSSKYVKPRCSMYGILYLHLA